MFWVIIGLGNGLAPVWCQAITCTNDDLSWNGPWGANFRQIQIKIPNYSIKTMHLKMLFVTWQPFYLDLIYSWVVQKLSHPTETYHQISNISCTKSQNLNVSRLVLELSLPNPSKPGVKSRMKMLLEHRQHAPTTSEWSRILLPAKVQLILEVWQ